MNSLLKLSIVLAVVIAAAVAMPQYGHGHGHGHGHEHHAVDYYAEPRYKFAYGVHDHYTGDIKSASETRDGAVTKGSYSLLQPDGITRTVNYVSDPVHGFQAQVLNDGHPVAAAPHH